MPAPHPLTPHIPRTSPVLLPSPASLSWDIFCRVVDNLGDVGVSWRLARGLAQRGQRVRLWIDEPGPLAWMAPEGAPGVEWARWPEPFPAIEPADVVVETFGCDVPGEVLRRLAARAAGSPPAGSSAPGPAQGPAPVWIDVEYLSAEPWVARSHALPSPQFHGPASGLTRWFFFPGFNPATGGLLREPGLLEARAAFDRDAWLGAHGLARRPGERVLVVFCYDDQPAFTRLSAAFEEAAGAGPLLMLLTPGPAQQLATGCNWAPGTRVHALPWFTQDDFDRLLWCADLCTVRGEDSLVRAIWAGVPFLWQAYPQHDGVHAAKVEAMLADLDAPAAVAAPLADAWRAWNGGSRGAALHPLRLPPLGPWGEAVRAWRARLAAQPDLVSQLLAFASTRAYAAG
ncbi:MAG: hypothetical protein RI988_2504 [Pseudomonadota bacterium]